MKPCCALDFSLSTSRKQPLPSTASHVLDFVHNGSDSSFRDEQHRVFKCPVFSHYKTRIPTADQSDPSLLTQIAYTFRFMSQIRILLSGTVMYLIHDLVQSVGWLLCQLFLFLLAAARVSVIDAR